MKKLMLMLLFLLIVAWCFPAFAGLTGEANAETPTIRAGVRGYKIRGYECWHARIVFLDCPALSKRHTLSEVPSTTVSNTEAVGDFLLIGSREPNHFPNEESM
jgi:hypothetical protein